MLGEPLKPYIKRLALEVGFDRCGIALARPIGRAAYVQRWLTRGRAGTMDFLRRNVEERLDPGELLPGAKSIVVVAQQYRQRPPTPEPPASSNGGPRGRVAMYAWGDDYHDVMKAKLHALADRMRAELAAPFESKTCVDTAPLLEREVAAAAGLGWIGKNTMVLDPLWGSYFFLGALVTTLPIEPDEPIDDHCGTCTACLNACPTGAFPAPYEMDASRCISYLTIEHREQIPESLQPMMGDWVFGCDACQQVCPHNRDAPVTSESRFAARPPGPTVNLNEVAAWSEEQYRQAVRGSATQRAKRSMWQRNAAIARRNHDLEVQSTRGPRP